MERNDVLTYLRRQTSPLTFVGVWNGVKQHPQPTVRAVLKQLVEEGLVELIRPLRPAPITYRVKA